MKQIILAIISKTEDKKQIYLLCSSVLDFGKYTGFFYPPAGTMSSDDKLETGLDIISA